MSRPLRGGGMGVRAYPLRKRNFFEALKKKLKKMWRLSSREGGLSGRATYIINSLNVFELKLSSRNIFLLPLAMTEVARNIGWPVTGHIFWNLVPSHHFISSLILSFNNIFPRLIRQNIFSLHRKWYVALMSGIQSVCVFFLCGW